VIADLTAYVVFLLVQDPLFSFRNMSVILRSHVSFFLSYLVIFMVQSDSFPPAHLAVLDFVMNTPVLVTQAIIHLIAPGVTLCPGAF
jgi:hypothetical protein